MKGGIARIIREDDIGEAVVNFFVKIVASNVTLKAVKDDGEYNNEIVSEKWIYLINAIAILNITN